MRESFITFSTIYYSALDLSDGDNNLFASLICAVYDYMLEGKEPDFKGNPGAKSWWRQAKSSLDHGNKTKKNKSEIDKRSITSAENGKKGGRPKKVVCEENNEFAELLKDE